MALSPRNTGSCVKARLPLVTPTYGFKQHIFVDNDSIENLRSAPREWTEADVLFDGKFLPKTALRLKGSSSFKPFDNKPCAVLSWFCKKDKLFFSASI